MRTLLTSTTGPKVQIEVPDGWYMRDRCVPNLFIPHELFGISNRPIPVQDDPDRSQPAVGKLRDDQLLLWCIYQTVNDPPDVSPADSMPEHASGNLPFGYYTMRTYPAGETRGWDGTQHAWRRAGTRAGDTYITLHLFEGNKVDGRVAERARAALASFSLR